VVYAYNRGVNIAKFMARSPSVAQRVFALEAFSFLAEANIDNIETILDDMSVQPTKWDGGMFVLEFCLKKGAANILTLEQEATPGGRRYDVVMKNGEKIELKNWSEWEGGKLDSIRDQFLYDFGYGNNVSDMHWKTYRYGFRAPAPDSIEVLRATFRGWLEKAMIDGGVNPDSRAKTLAAFDAHAADIIFEVPGFWSGTPAARVSPPTIPMPVQDKGDKDQPSPPPGSNR
jgi:hypothetical protein